MLSRGSWKSDTCWPRLSHTSHLVARGAAGQRGYEGQHLGQRGPQPVGVQGLLKHEALVHEGTRGCDAVDDGKCRGSIGGGGGGGDRFIMRACRQRVFFCCHAPGQQGAAQLGARLRHRALERAAGCLQFGPRPQPSATARRGSVSKALRPRSQHGIAGVCSSALRSSCHRSRRFARRDRQRVAHSPLLRASTQAAGVTTGLVVHNRDRRCGAGTGGMMEHES